LHTLCPSPPHTSTPSLHDALPISLVLVIPLALFAAPEEPAALRPKVARLVEQLGIPAKQVAAETELLNLGPDVLPYLPDDKAKLDRKSTRLNSSHLGISYAVFCLK